MTSRREVVEQSLQQIWDERAQLTPADVLEVASEPAHPLHGFFVWDNDKAAQQWRLAQAAGLIRSVKIRFTVEKGDSVEDRAVRRWIAPRAYDSSPSTPQGYLPESEVGADPQLRAMVLRGMKRDILALRRRYESYSEFWEEIALLPAERDAAAG